MAQNFESIGISSELNAHLQKRFQIHTPTEVQSKVIPALLKEDGRDVLVKSATGSGKTLAFLLPILQTLSPVGTRLDRTHRSVGTQCLIFAPTRELCSQIQKVLELLLLRFVFLVSGSLTGGDNRSKEKSRMRKGLNIIVSTPNRFIDHLNKTEVLTVSLEKEQLKFLVLDEADRLCDKGFGVQISEVLEKLKDICPVSLDSSRKVFVSATVNERINLLIQSYLKKPILVDIAEEKRMENSAETVKQKYSLPDTLQEFAVISPLKEKFVLLYALLMQLQKKKGSKILLFVACRAETEFLEHCLKNIKWPPEEGSSLELNIQLIHGSLDHKLRKKVMKSFVSETQTQLLIATDVAARGLDVDGVDIVINYRAPSELSEYVHRVGRTARVKTKGKSFLFVSQEEEKFIGYLESKLITKISKLKLDAIKRILRLPSKTKTEKSLKRKRVDDIRTKAQFDSEVAGKLFQILFEDMVEANKELGAMAETAYRAAVTSYTVYDKSLRRFFNHKILHKGHLQASFGLRGKKKDHQGKGKKPFNKSNNNKKFGSNR